MNTYLSYLQKLFFAIRFKFLNVPMNVYKPILSDNKIFGNRFGISESINCASIPTYVQM